MPDKIDVHCDKIRVDEGDVVLAHVKTKNVSPDQAALINQELKRVFPKNRVVALIGDVDVESIKRKIADGSEFGGKTRMVPTFEGKA